jgi:hypothetical protein
MNTDKPHAAEPQPSLDSRHLRLGFRLSDFLRLSAFGFRICPLLFLVVNARAEWQRTDTSLAWKSGQAIVWQFNFDPATSGKPFFHPLNAVGGPVLTERAPVDHPWHYGLWFSWKYINEKNYWEEDRTSGKPAGKTVWTTPVIVTNSEGGAIIKMALTYTNPDIPRVDMVESREITVSAPDADGGYRIDWQARFVAGPDGALLDRTKMPNEPGGANNGGYAGMSIRMAPSGPSYVSIDGPVTNFTYDGMPQQTRTGERARPNSPAMAFNYSQDGKPAGGIAFLSDPKNTESKPATWYLINGPRQNPPFYFAVQSLLAPKSIQLAPGEKLELRYRFVVSRAAWTPASLKTALDAWSPE